LQLGTLAGVLGSFPLVHEAYPSQTHSRAVIRGIRSLIGFGILDGTLAHSVLYHRGKSHKAAPKGISGRTSYNGI
jgi:hypothetical protein